MLSRRTEPQPNANGAETITGEALSEENQEAMSTTDAIKESVSNTGATLRDKTSKLYSNLMNRFSDDEESESKDDTTDK